MNKKITVSAGCIFLFLLAYFMYSAIPTPERAALISLYNATDGDNWFINTNWKGIDNESDGFSKIGTEDQWYGITVKDNHVTEIKYNWNKLSGTIPPQLANLNYLKKLAVGNSKISGNIPPELGNITSLTELLLFKSELSGTIPKELGNLTALNYLNLSENRLTGSIPKEFGNLTLLTFLWISRNQLSGNIPPELGNLFQLFYFFGEYNQFNGNIPKELGNLANLRQINMSFNQFDGTLPAELGKLSRVETFILKSNQLSGAIPVEFGNLHNLKHLDLGFNFLSGSIPTALGNLENLEKLYLHKNLLTGSIPAELGKLSKLSWLWLNENELSGPIPTELGNLKNLYSLYLYANKICGRIPDSITGLTDLKGHYHTDIRYNGLYTDNETARKFLNDAAAVQWEKSQTIAPLDVFAYATSDTSVRVCFTPIVYQDDGGGYRVYYSTTSGGPYTDAGITPGKSEDYLDVTGLSPDTMYYFIVKSQTDPHLQNANTVLSLASPEVSAATGAVTETETPFGFFETPIDGTTTAGSVPLTGWALDDTGVKSVKIYRQEGDALLYVGDAVSVEGARPDVAAAYPGYPNKTKAGWGYMLLTNLLPNSGTGSYIFQAAATDFANKTTVLGTKTIICDNASSVKPFGAIDTPTQGGIASGNKYINFGWALTPQPNTIPTDGSTIGVYVDGVKIGKPTYNIYRPDIPALFPYYKNSNGAVGYFYLDTTKYSSGVHTIGWSVTDDAGSTEGIGSRYFTISNTGSINTQDTTLNSNTEQSDLLIKYTNRLPVRIKKGCTPGNPTLSVYPDENGLISVEIKELERIEIHFYEDTEAGQAFRIKNRLPLPTGSTLDSKNGIFYWMPGPGFVGEYRFDFMETNPNGSISKRNIVIRILPKN